jgi:hypothetical protein
MIILLPLAALNGSLILESAIRGPSLLSRPAGVEQLTILGAFLLWFVSLFAVVAAVAAMRYARREVIRSERRKTRDKYLALLTDDELLEVAPEVFGREGDHLFGTFESQLEAIRSGKTSTTRLSKGAASTPALGSGDPSNPGAAPST